jgi:putative Holliday junction resolvase
VSRYLGIDHGARRVGLAISDPTLTIAQPLKTITYSSSKILLNEIQKVVRDFEVVRVIVGLPLTLKGSDSEKTREVRLFADHLTSFLELPVELFDERLTTLQAHQTLKQLGKKPSKNREMVDQLAAQKILQTYLDREKYQSIL